MSLPQFIPLQSVPFIHKGDDGNMYIEINWYLFLYNLSINVLTPPASGGGGAPASPNDIADAIDLDAVTTDIPGAYRKISSIEALESMNGDMPSPDLAKLIQGLANLSASSSSVAEPEGADIASLKRRIANLEAMLCGCDGLVPQNMPPNTVQIGAEEQLPAGYLLANNNLSELLNASTARTNLSAAKSGANTDITSLTPNSVAISAISTLPLTVGGSLTGGSGSPTATNVAPTIQSDATGTAAMYQTAPATVAASFTVGTLAHFRATQGAIGSGSAISAQYGFQVTGSLTGAASNYGFFGNIAAASGRWNAYMAGSAANYFAGNVQIGSATATAGAENLQVAGSLSISSATMLRTYTSFTNGAAAASGTLTNAPAAGNPTKWIPINDNGTVRYIPAW